MAVCFCHRKPDRFADVLLASRDRTDADIQPEYVGHDVFDEALALVVNAGQQRDHDLRVRAEVPSRHPLRQTGLCGSEGLNGYNPTRYAPENYKKRASDK